MIQFQVGKSIACRSFRRMRNIKSARTAKLPLLYIQVDNGIYLPIAHGRHIVILHTPNHLRVYLLQIVQTGRTTINAQFYTTTQHTTNGSFQFSDHDSIQTEFIYKIYSIYRGLFFLLARIDDLPVELHHNTLRRHRSFTQGYSLFLHH